MSYIGNSTAKPIGERTTADPECVLWLAIREGREWDCKLYSHRGGGWDLNMAKIIGRKKVRCAEFDSGSRWFFTTQRRFSYVLQGTWKSYQAYKVLKQNKKHSTLVNYVINKKDMTNDMYHLILQYL
tara:strand:+ start:101 stop:481 length:381 start_codon:yes stop_codon:yes gene_type:complete